MLKFAKYFFIVFLITAILPLVLMFAWNNSQMEKFHNAMAKSAMSTGLMRLEYSVKTNLKVQEGDILRKLYYILPNDKNLSHIKNILNDYNTEVIQKPIKTPVSFYERKNFDLYCVTLVPFDNSTKGLKISKPVSLDLLRPTGPYTIELRFNKDDAAYEFKNVAFDPMAFGPPKKVFLLLSRVAKPHYKENSRREIALKGEDNSNAAYLTIELAFGPFRGMIDSIFTSLIILLVGILSSFVIGLIIKRVFVTPVMALSKAADQVKKGNLNFKLDATSKIEIIKNLYENFNDMILNLQTKEKLRESFISNLTHDLRTPLVSQSQSLEFISQKFKEIGLTNEYELAESLAKNNEHLLKMVNLILDSYSFDPEKLKLSIEKADLYEIIEDCKEQLKPLLAEKNIEFVNNIYKGGTLIEADLFQIKRVLINLLSNAIDNTSSENKYIKAAARFEDEEVLITIEDNGNGIAKEDLKFIFDRYYSGKSLERKLGSGFGLSVCQKLIDMHNGQITVESEINKYTKFIITLPLSQHPGKGTKEQP